MRHFSAGPRTIFLIRLSKYIQWTPIDLKMMINMGYGMSGELVLSLEGRYDTVNVTRERSKRGTFMISS